MMFENRKTCSRCKVHPYFIVFIVALSGLLAYGLLTTGHDWGGDFSQYLMQAESITERNIDEFMDENRFTMEHSSFAVGPVAYPWGYPLLLAPLYVLVGNNMVALKLVNVVLYLFFLLLLWFGFQREHSEPWRLALLLLFAFNPEMLGFMDSLFADIPFLLFSTASVLLMRAVFIDKKEMGTPFTGPFLLGCLIAVSLFFRNNGVLLLGALLVTQAFLLISAKKNQSYLKSFSFSRFLFHALPYITCGLLLITWNFFFPRGGASHVEHLQEISFSLILQQIHYYLHLPADFFSGVSRPFHLMVFGASFPFTLLGIIRRYRRDYPLLVYCALTLLLYIIWPYRQGLRFVFPVLPFYISFTLSGLTLFARLLEEVMGRKLSWIFSAVPVALIIIIMTASTMMGVHKNLSQNREFMAGPFSPPAQDMFGYIRMMQRGSASDEVIIFFKPRVMRFMTGMSSILIREHHKLDRADYICLHPAPDEDQIPLEIRRSLVEEGKLEPRYSNNTFTLYKIHK